MVCRMLGAILGSTAFWDRVTVTLGLLRLALRARVWSILGLLIRCAEFHALRPPMAPRRTILLTHPSPIIMMFYFIFVIT